MPLALTFVSTISWSSVGLGLLLGIVLGGAFLLLRRRSVTVVQDEALAAPRGSSVSASASLSSAPAPTALSPTAVVAAEPYSEATAAASTLTPAEVQEMLHEFFPGGAPGAGAGATAQVIAGEPHISGSTRVLSGAEAQQFLHASGLDRTVAAALGRVPATPSAQPSYSPSAPLLPQKTRRTGPALLLGLLIFAVPLGFLAHSIFRSFAPAHLGTVTSTGPVLGDWTMDVDSCHTGMTRGFYGAQFYSSKDPRLGIWMVEDPLRGLVASVNSTTHGDAVNLSRAECTVLSGSAKGTGTYVNNVRVLKGEYTLDCQAEGSHVSGQVSFSHCL